MPSFRDALVNVLKDLSAAEVPDDLREIAFTKGLEFHLGYPYPAAPEPAVPASISARRGMIGELPRGDVSTDDDQLAAIAHRLSLPIEDVRDVYNISGDGEIEIIVASGKLPPGDAPATKELALLVAAGRQSVGEEWTPFGEIRVVCDIYGRLDSSNFATTIREMEDVFNMRSPTPRKREVRINRPGWERAAALVSRLTSGGA